MPGTHFPDWREQTPGSNCRNSTEPPPLQLLELNTLCSAGLTASPPLLRLASSLLIDNFLLQTAVEHFHIDWNHSSNFLVSHFWFIYKQHASFTLLLSGIISNELIWTLFICCWFICVTWRGLLCLHRKQGKIFLKMTYALWFIFPLGKACPPLTTLLSLSGGVAVVQRLWHCSGSRAWAAEYLDNCDSKKSLSLKLSYASFKSYFWPEQQAS